MLSKDKAQKLYNESDNRKFSWVYAAFVGALEDVKDEYKRRANTAYEAAQIRKSEDCYDTPYHTELVVSKMSMGIQWAGRK